MSADSLAFQPAGSAFSFDTGFVRGQLRAKQKSFGLIPVELVATSNRLASSMGHFGLYRVFANGQRLGAGAWDWPSEAALQPDGSVLIRCAAATNRPFELTGQYRWSSPRTLDFEITVTAQAELRGFEVFLASYFSSAFTNASVCVPGEPTAKALRFLRADRALGEWQMYPRDAAAVRLIQDGRWGLPPHPVEWKIAATLANPLAVRQAPDSGLAALLMAEPGECFAIALPYETEGHYSTYFSLFGRDVAAGQTVRARARLQWFERPAAADFLPAYEQFVRSLGK